MGGIDGSLLLEICWFDDRGKFFVMENVISIF